MSYDRALEKAIRHAEKVKLKQELNEVKHANDKKKKSLSFSKVLVIFIFCNFIVIELYSMFAMVWLHDLSALGSLIFGIIGQCSTAIGYFIKSGKENTADGIVYETTIRELEYELENRNNNDDNAVG